MHDDETPTVALRRLANGYQVTQAIHVAAALGIADLLRDGPRDSDALAQETATHAPSLHRVLRALASVGVLHEGDDGRFALTAIGECLRSDAAEPVGAWAAFVGRPYHWQAWGALLHGVRTGESPFRSVYGTDVWDYRAAHPEEDAIFNAAMTDIMRRANAAPARGLRLRALRDRGRRGRRARRLPRRGARGQPRRCAGSSSTSPMWSRARSSASAARSSAAASSRRCPEGADAYLLKAVLHDWEDDDALRDPGAAAARRSPRTARCSSSSATSARANENADAKLSDLNMLVGAGGRERTRDEFAALFAAGGFALQSATPSAIGLERVRGPSRLSGATRHQARRCRAVGRPRSAVG